jgi:hypothetical protein
VGISSIHTLHWEFLWDTGYVLRATAYGGDHLMISLEFIAKCEPRELVKVKVENGTEWVIVGVRRPGYAPLVFLTGDNAPFVFNMEPDPGDFEKYPGLRFGTKYRFLPDPNGPCQVGVSQLSKTAGSVVLTQDDGDLHLVINQYRQTGVRLLHER